MKNWKIQTAVFLIVDIFFAVTFFSERAALALPFVISPIVFILFIAFFRNPRSFMQQWNGWLIWIIKFSFLIVGLIIYKNTNYFPSVDDLITQKPLFSATYYVGQTEDIIFVLLATVAQIGFMIGILFNILVLTFQNKLGPNAPGVKISFKTILILSILFTMFFTLGLLLLGVLLK